MQAPPHDEPHIFDLSDGPSLAVLGHMADALPWPMMVLHPGGWLLVANRAARRLLNDGRTMALHEDRRLLLTPARLQGQLDEAMAAAVTAGTRSLLQWPGPGSGYAVTVTRLEATTPDGPAHVLLVLASDDSRTADTRGFAQLHRLSPAETRVLMYLARGESSTRVAQALGVSSSTVRSQILNLRRKTGHASVAHLLRALNSMPPMGTATEGVVNSGE